MSRTHATIARAVALTAILVLSGCIGTTQAGLSNAPSPIWRAGGAEACPSLDTGLSNPATTRCDGAPFELQYSTRESPSQTRSYWR